MSTLTKKQKRLTQELKEIYDLLSLDFYDIKLYSKEQRTVRLELMKRAAARQAVVTDRLNVPLKLRQQRLGHSDAAMTLGVYSHVAQEDDVHFAAQLGGILDPSGPFEKGKGPAPVTQALVN